MNVPKWQIHGLFQIPSGKLHNPQSRRQSRDYHACVLPNFFPRNLSMLMLPAIFVPSTSRTGARPNGIPLKKYMLLNASWKCQYHLAFLVFFSPLFALKPNVFVFHTSLSEDYASCFCATPGIKIIQLVRHGRYQGSRKLA